MGSQEQKALEQPGPIAADDRRFAFGKNWSKFLAVVSEDQVAKAEESLQRMLGVEDLRGKSFLDVGSGSGLFSLAARRLGACVHSFDCDPQSVACTMELKRRYFPGDSNWTITEGSVVDGRFLKSLGTFDVVYAWGVLHHTGAMWSALENITSMVDGCGKLFLSIYNDQEGTSRRWKVVKRTYNALPSWVRFAVLGPAFIRVWGLTLLRDLLKGNPVRTWRTYKNGRGMSPWRDVVDWVGGYPFEVAKPEEIFEFFRSRGFVLVKLKTCGGGHGCNEFVFHRSV